MKRKVIYMYLSAVALSPCIALADTNSVFETAVTEILSNNPTLAASRAKAEAESLNLRAENNLQDPEVEFEHQWGSPSVGGNKWSISISQSFDWPGVYHIRSKATEAQVTAYRLLYLADESDMRLRVSSTLVDYIAARKQLRLAQTISDNLSEIALKTSRSFDSGEATIIDFRKAEFERVRALARTDAARSLVDNLRSEIISLNGGRYVSLDSLNEFPNIVLQTEDYYAARHATHDPAVIAGTYLTEAAARTAKAAARNWLPGLSLGYIHNVELGDHFNGIKAGITLPIFANRHRRASALAEEETARLTAEETLLAVNRRVMSDYAEAKALTLRANEYATLFPDGKDESDYLSLLFKSFEGGRMSLIVYLYEINYYNEAQADFISLLHKRTLSLLSLSRFD